MAGLLPVSWDVRVQIKVSAVCMLLSYFNTTNDGAPSAATVAKTAVSAALFVSGTPSCTIFRRKM
jgi:hypothetical protein